MRSLLLGLLFSIIPLNMVYAAEVPEQVTIEIDEEEIPLEAELQELEESKKSSVEDLAESTHTLIILVTIIIGFLVVYILKGVLKL